MSYLLIHRACHGDISEAIKRLHPENREWRGLGQFRPISTSIEFCLTCCRPWKLVLKVLVYANLDQLLDKMTTGSTLPVSTFSPPIFQCLLTLKVIGYRVLSEDCAGFGPIGAITCFPPRLSLYILCYVLIAYIMINKRDGYSTS